MISRPGFGSPEVGGGGGDEDGGGGWRKEEAIATKCAKIRR